MALRFEWHKGKAESNLRAHRVSFHEATTAFADPLSITISDPDHSLAEMCFTQSGPGESASSAQDSRLEMNKGNMKKHAKKKARISNRMRREYDFSKGVRGKHAARYASGTNVVVLAPDVSRHFPTADDVNETLRAVSRLIARWRSRSKHPTA